MALLAPWPLAILIDTVLGNKPLPSLLGLLDGLGRYELLAIAVGAGLLFTALEHGLAVVDDYVNTKLDQKMVLELRSDMFRARAPALAGLARQEAHRRADVPDQQPGVERRRDHRRDPAAAAERA